MSKFYVISSSDSEPDVKTEDKMVNSFPLSKPLVPPGEYSPLQKSSVTKPTYEISSSDEELPPLYERILLSRRCSQKQEKNCTSSTSLVGLPSCQADEFSEIPKTKSSLSESHYSEVRSNLGVDIRSDPRLQLAANSIEISSDEDEMTTQSMHAVVDVLPDINEEDELEDLPELDVLPAACSSSSTVTSQDSGSMDELAMPAKKRKLGVKKSAEEIQAEREEKRRQRETKLALAQREKVLKQIQREEKQSSKPGECIKFVTAIIDMALLEMPDAVDLPRILQESNVQYSLVEQPVRCSVTWRRQIVQNAVSDDLQVDKRVRKEEEAQAITLILAKQFVEAVHHFKQNQFGNGGGDTLLDVVRQHKAAFPGKHLTVFICGISKYFQQQKSKQQREYRTNVLDGGSQPATRGRSKQAKTRIKDIPFKVSRVDVEEAIIDLQIQEPCNVRFLETSTELANVIASFTKAVAEAPYKQTKDGNGGFSWFANGESRQAVKINKDGSGLLALWQKQIEQFSLVSADVAQAVVGEYSSPRELVRAYGQCGSEQECEKLLKDIMVRRGVGPLATTRRIGPELSRKIYLMFTSTNGDLVLDAN